MSKKREAEPLFKNNNLEREAEHSVLHEAGGHETLPSVEAVYFEDTNKEAKKENTPEKTEFARALDFDEFEDDDEEEGIEHPENNPRFPLERKFLFYFGLAVLIVPVIAAVIVPFIPTWLVIPIFSPISVFFMALGVGKEHAHWHAKDVVRKIRIGVKNFIRGLLG